MDIYIQLDFKREGSYLWGGRELQDSAVQSSVPFDFMSSWCWSLIGTVFSEIKLLNDPYVKESKLRIYFISTSMGMVNNPHRATKSGGY